MRKLMFVFLVGMLLLLAASPVYAADAPATGNNWGPIGVGLGMGLAAGLAGLGQGRVGGSVAEAIARNPGARDGIQIALFIGLAFIESLVLFTFVLLLIKT